jgi:hypothetical protein
MNMLRSAALLAVAIPLVGCQTTDPLSAASIDYRLPRTDAQYQLALTLKECREAGFTVDAELAVVAIAGAQADVRRIPGAALASARIKRGLQITVSDAGVVTGINSSNSDQTPAIIGNALKIAATLAGVAAVGRDGPLGLKCRPEIVNATERGKVVESQIAHLREKLAKAGTNSRPTAKELKMVREVNILARELASLRIGLLRVEVKGPIKLDGPKTNEALNVDIEPFKKWFDPENSNLVVGIPRYFGLQWTATAAAANILALAPASDKKLRACKLSVELPQTQSVTLTVSGIGESLRSLTAEEALPVAQWLAPAKLCLDVGFGESRTVVLAFDSYGRTKDMNWSTEATAATVSTAFGGSIDSVAGLVTTLRGPSDLAKQKAQIDDLETQLKLNQLLACRAVIDAGGFDCDGE